jgi:hypothetical protein
MEIKDDAETDSTQHILQRLDDNHEMLQLPS